MPDEIDDLVRAAAKAHEGLAPAGYFDDLDRRVLARLDRSHGELADLPEAVSMMSETENHSGRDRGTSPEGALPRDGEDSGLHDMRALAQTTKARISRRVTSQHDALDDSLASSSSGLRAVALPEPARLVALPDMPLATGTSSVARIVGPGAARSAGAVPPIRRRKTGMMVAMGAGLFAVAVGAVVVLGGGRDQAEPSAASEAAVATGTAADPAVRPLDTAAAAPVVAPTGASAPSGTAAGAGAGTSSTSGTGASNAGTRDQVAEASAAAKRDGRADGAVAPRTAADKPADRRAKPDADRPAGAKPAKDGAAPASAPGAKPATGGGDKSIEDLLDEASGGAQKPSEVGSAPKGPEKTGLDGKDIKAGMSAVAGRAQACFDTHGVAGHVKVKATVDASGKVTKADATGEFAGTPTGGCVASAARAASFPSWTGGPMTISYMFTLQE